MGNINWGRVFLGGLLAGLVANILGFIVFGVFLAKDWAAAMEAIGHPMQETVGMYVFYVVLYFVVGIAAIWLYAAMRPRYGPGPKTAAGAGFAYWVIGGLLPTIGWGSMGLFPTRLLALDTGLSAVILIIATIAGAWAYKE